MSSSVQTPTSSTKTCGQRKVNTRRQLGEDTHPFLRLVVKCRGVVDLGVVILNSCPKLKFAFSVILIVGSLRDLAG